MGLFLRGFKLTLLVLGLGSLLLSPAFASPAYPRPASIPEGVGLNIHFLDPLPGEMEMLGASGIKWVRADFYWQWIEKEPGRYDFSAHDRFLAALKPYGIRPIFMLCYGHPLYDQGKPPFSEEGREAFVRWVKASLEHFRGKGVLWEMWNEPNISIFWPPKPNVQDFIRLSLKVGQAFQETAPGEFLFGPALNKMDFKFLEACFQAGLLNYWSGVSVHPYRKKDPEGVGPDYEKLEALIARYAPPGREIPILSAEWGFSTQWRGFDETRQAKYLARQWLFNAFHRIPLSIWYDWRDDGLDPKNQEHHYGTVFHDHHPERNPPFDPKPAYQAAKTFNTALAGFQFTKRLAVGGADDYVLLFKKGEDQRLVAWTRSKTGRNLLIPSDPGLFKTLSHLGDNEGTYLATPQGLCVPLSDAPQYFTPASSNALLQESPAWSDAYARQIRGKENPCSVLKAK